MFHDEVPFERAYDCRPYAYPIGVVEAARDSAEGESTPPFQPFHLRLYHSVSARIDRRAVL